MLPQTEEASSALNRMINIKKYVVAQPDDKTKKHVS